MPDELVERLSKLAWEERAKYLAALSTHNSSHPHTPWEQVWDDGQESFRVGIHAVLRELGLIKRTGLPPTSGLYTYKLRLWPVGSYSAGHIDVYAGGTKACFSDPVLPGFCEVEWWAGPIPEPLEDDDEQG